MGCDGRCRARQDLAYLINQTISLAGHGETAPQHGGQRNQLAQSTTGQSHLRASYFCAACISHAYLMEIVLLWCASSTTSCFGCTHSEIGHYRVADTICAMRRGEASRVLRSRRQINLFGSRRSLRAVLQVCDFSFVPSLGISA